MLANFSSTGSVSKSSVSLNDVVKQSQSSVPSDDEQDKLVMETKLQIIEILQVRKNFKCLSQWTD